MTNLKNFYQKKSLFFINKKPNKLNFSKVHFFFKTNLLLNLFFKYFGWKDFYLFYFVFSKLLTKTTCTNLYKKKNNYYAFLKYKFFYLYKNYKYLEFLNIPNLLRFNLNFLTKKLGFLWFFEFQLTLIFFNVCKNSSFVNKFLQTLKKKFNFIILHNQIFYENIKFIKQHKIYLYLLTHQNSKKFNNNFSKTYIGYQSFLNTNLYLTRSFIFSNIIGPASFDFLLLKNLNKIFFWTGDLKANTFVPEFLIWNTRNVIFWKGEFYNTYKLESWQNNFIPFYNFNQLLIDNTGDDVKKYFNFNNFIFCTH